MWTDSPTGKVLLARNGAQTGTVTVTVVVSVPPEEPTQIFCRGHLQAGHHVQPCTLFPATACNHFRGASVAITCSSLLRWSLCASRHRTPSHPSSSSYTCCLAPRPQDIEGQGMHPPPSVPSCALPARHDGSPQDASRNFKSVTSLLSADLLQNILSTSICPEKADKGCVKKEL